MTSRQPFPKAREMHHRCFISPFQGFGPSLAVRWAAPIAFLFHPSRALSLQLLFDGLHPSLFYFALSGLWSFTCCSMGCTHRFFITPLQDFGPSLAVRWAAPIAVVLRSFRALVLHLLFDGLHPTLFYYAPSGLRERTIVFT